MTEYVHADELISEIESSAYFKDNPHLIDRPAIYRWIYLEMKQFGRSVMHVTQNVVNVENYNATLPKDFGKLSLAIFCEPDTYTINSGSRDHLMNTYIWNEKIKSYADECSPENPCETPQVGCIVERQYFHTDGEVEIRYKNPRYVKLGRGIKGDNCDKDCINRDIKQSPYSIDIHGNKIKANFRTGKLYIEYYALPQDEDGVPVIPNTNYGFLEKYLEQYIRRKLLEEAMYTKDATNLQGLFQFAVQKEQEFLVEALKDVRNSDMQMYIKAMDVNRNRYGSYKVNLGQL